VQDGDSYEIDDDDHEALDTAIGEVDLKLNVEDKEARSAMSETELDAAKTLYNDQIDVVLDTIGNELNALENELNEVAEEPVAEEEQTEEPVAEEEEKEKLDALEPSTPEK
jgi:hypothetical protein